MVDLTEMLKKLDDAQRDLAAAFESVAEMKREIAKFLCPFKEGDEVEILTGQVKDGWKKAHFVSSSYAGGGVVACRTFDGQKYDTVKYYGDRKPDSNEIRGIKKIIGGLPE